jgi:hypothetical protein
MAPIGSMFTIDAHEININQRARGHIKWSFVATAWRILIVQMKEDGGVLTVADNRQQ